MEVSSRLWQTHKAEHLYHSLARLGFGYAAVDHERLGHLVPDPHGRIEGAQRVLENHADFVPTNVADLRLGTTDEIKVFETDPSRNDLPPSWQQAEDRPPGHGFT
jgi:hypothetical protein